MTPRPPSRCCFGGTLPGVPECWTEAPSRLRASAPTRSGAGRAARRSLCLLPAVKPGGGAAVPFQQVPGMTQQMCRQCICSCL